MGWYTGITLGPIYDTLQLTSSPAGLWGASSLFSWIAERMLCSLMNQELDAKDFISPCFQWDTSNQKTVLDGCDEMRRLGVGMFHDRIILTGRELEKCRIAFDQTLDELAQKIREAISASERSEAEPSVGQIRSWLSAYLRIHAIEAYVPEDQAPILYMGERLAAIELEPNFVVSEKTNPLLLLFENARSYQAGGGDRLSEQVRRRMASNEKIKNSFLVSDKGRWMLSYGDNQIRDIQHIACSRKEDQQWKTSSYYVVLQSDGDGMGAVLKTLKNKEEIQAYSSKCLRFCAEASRLMYSYGAMPIYAGGDDLMSILPLTGNNPRFTEGNPERETISIFGMVNILLETFNSIFSEERRMHRGDYGQPIPTVSFGLSVQYVKSPLYEAVNHSRDMLWKAKSGAKNTLCMRLEKHSGSPIELEIGNLDGIIDGVKLPKPLISYFDDMIMDTRAAVLTARKKGEQADFLSGAGYQCEKHRKLFEYAIRQIAESDNMAMFHNLFENLFDNAAQKRFADYISQIEEIAVRIIRETRIFQSDHSETYCSEMANTVFDVIRVLRFTLEKGGESK